MDTGSSYDTDNLLFDKTLIFKPDVQHSTIKSVVYCGLVADHMCNVKLPKTILGGHVANIET